MMIARDKRVVRIGYDRAGGSPSERVRLVDAYGEFLARQIEPKRRYSVIRIADAEFAYTHYVQYTRALGDVWAAGSVPETAPAVAGSSLPGAAPRLRGVDADVADFLGS